MGALAAFKLNEQSIKKREQLRRFCAIQNASANLTSLGLVIAGGRPIVENSIKTSLENSIAEYQEFEKKGGKRLSYFNKKITSVQETYLLSLEDLGFFGEENISLVMEFKNFNAILLTLSSNLNDRNTMLENFNSKAAYNEERGSIDFPKYMVADLKFINSCNLNALAACKALLTLVNNLSDYLEEYIVSNYKESFYSNKIVEKSDALT